MRYLWLLLPLFLTACGPSQEDIDNIATITCNIMGESRNMDAAMRLQKINEARTEIGADPFLGKDDEIKEAFAFGLCLELVKADPDYDEKLAMAYADERSALAEAAAAVEAAKAAWRGAVTEIAPSQLNITSLKAIYNRDNYRGELMGMAECGDSNLITKTRLFFSEPLEFLNAIESAADIETSVTTIFCKGEKKMRFDLMPYEKKSALFEFLKGSPGFSYLRDFEVDVLDYVTGAEVTISSEYGCHDGPEYEEYKTVQGTRGSDFPGVPCRTSTGPLDVEVTVMAEDRQIRAMSNPSE